MTLILHIETATRACSVALSRAGSVLALRESLEGRNHGEVITSFIATVTKEAGVELKALDAVAVSKGPGSYTGLRIGVSTAKGICYALGKPLVAVNTLEGMCQVMKKNLPASCSSALLCPMIDARRMEVYCAVYDQEGREIRSTSAEIIDEHSFREILEKQAVVFFGDGASKCREKLAHNPGAVFIENVWPSAAGLVKPAEEKFLKEQFEDLAYFEPFYLKDFVKP